MAGKINSEPLDENSSPKYLQLLGRRQEMKKNLKSNIGSKIDQNGKCRNDESLLPTNQLKNIVYCKCVE